MRITHLHGEVNMLLDVAGTVYRPVVSDLSKGCPECHLQRDGICDAVYTVSICLRFYTKGSCIHWEEYNG